MLHRLSTFIIVFGLLIFLHSLLEYNVLVGYRILPLFPGYESWNASIFSLKLQLKLHRCLDSHCKIVKNNNQNLLEEKCPQLECNFVIKNISNLVYKEWEIIHLYLYVRPSFSPKLFLCHYVDMGLSLIHI